MSFLRRQRKPNMDGVNLLMTLLLCYPEIGTVTFDPAKGETLQMSFALNRLPGDEENKSFGRFLTESISTYHSLLGLPEGKLNITLEGNGKAAILGIKRDMATISRGEIKLVASLVKDTFGESLVTDPDMEKNTPDEATRLAHEENIDNILGSVRYGVISETLVGYREAGRVMVYNK